MENNAPEKIWIDSGFIENVKHTQVLEINSEKVDEDSIPYILESEHKRIVEELKKEKESSLKKRYYFITYQATNKQGSVSIWHQVIDQSPMEYIKNVQEVEQNGSNTYYKFVVINTCEISEKDFNEYKGNF